MGRYDFGVGKAEIKYDKKGLPMAGFADPTQKTSVPVQGLYARAFAIRHPTQSVFIAIVDLWVCSKLLKDMVLTKLAERGLRGVTEDVLMICGTHTHAAPAGYSGSKFYDSLVGPADKVHLKEAGYPGDPTFLNIAAAAIAEAIFMAYITTESGEIRLSRADVLGCGSQRSLKAYEANPPAERGRYPFNTDREMLVLSFHSNYPTPAGIIAWYPLHPTCLRQDNTMVSGDCMGYAASLLESDPNGPRVAAFANSNCGDVSPNVGVNVKEPNATADNDRMKLIGQSLAEGARDALGSKGMVLDGPVTSFFKRRNMGEVTIAKGGGRTWPAALGLSFIAGSSEDSITKQSIAGLTLTLEDLKPLHLDRVYEGITKKKLDAGTGLSLGAFATVLSVHFGTPLGPSDDLAAGHGDKPIVLVAGDYPHFIANTLPLQVFQIGPLAILGFPGELSTMAGRRLRETMAREYRPNGYRITEVALSTYANDYAQYVTTKEEYAVQHYEGASTLFGPETLAAFEQEFSRLDDHRAMYITTSAAKPGFDVKVEWIIDHYHGGEDNCSHIIEGGEPSKTLEIPSYARDITYALFVHGLPDMTLKRGPLGIRPGERRVLYVDMLKGGVILGDPLEKRIKILNDTAFDVIPTITYKDAKGVEQTQSRTWDQFLHTDHKVYTFSIPWDATGIVAKAEWSDFGNFRMLPAYVAGDLRSGELLSLKVYNSMFFDAWKGMALNYVSKGDF